MLLGGALALAGCGAGQYQIPNVEPVVKQKPQDDLLEDIEGNTDKPADTSGPSEPAAGSSEESSGSSGDSAKPAEGAKPAPKK
jgi:hypothetical protein